MPTFTDSADHLEVADGCDSVILEWVRLGTTEEMVHVLAGLASFGILLAHLLMGSDEGSYILLRFQ